MTEVAGMDTIKKLNTWLAGYLFSACHTRTIDLLVSFQRVTPLHEAIGTLVNQ